MILNIFNKTIKMHTVQCSVLVNFQLIACKKATWVEQYEPQEIMPFKFFIELFINFTHLKVNE